MEYSDWEPIYKQILADFDFDQNKDEEAAILLRKLFTYLCQNLSKTWNS